MSTRTWLTTPTDQAPVTDERSTGGERYVPGPGLPSEPRVPGRHRTLIALVIVAVVAITAVALMVILGEEAQRFDPAAPTPDEGEAPMELPEA